MELLKVTRYKQEPAGCAIASCASIANYFNKEVDYTLTKHITQKEVCKDLSSGMYTGHMGILLNHLGFEKVTIITCDLDYVDYAWSRMSKKCLIDEMSRVIRSRYQAVDEDKRKSLMSLREFLNVKKRNQIKIDHHFGDYIRKYVYKNIPVIVSYNWNMFFKYPKYNDFGVADPIRGSSEYHAVVVRGYNEKEAYIVDSHWECYTKNLKKYKKGYYKIKWEELMTIIGNGDVIIAENYNRERLHYELV